MITGLQRVSKPGRRSYIGHREIPWVRRAGDQHCPDALVCGDMTGRQAQLKLGGELLCKVW